MHEYRSHTCNDLRSDQSGEIVRLSGWVHRKRDHGGLLFIDLRDHYGVTQCVFDSDFKEIFEIADNVRAESVIRVEGEVIKRDAESINPDLPTGEVEILVKKVNVLNEAAELPMPVFGDQEYPEDIRLKYRFLDLRRDRIHSNIVLRSDVISSIRRRMVDQGFRE
jgi:aspartyl-tRNA synthetase